MLFRGQSDDKDTVRLDVSSNTQNLSLKALIPTRRPQRIEVTLHKIRIGTSPFNKISEPKRLRETSRIKQGFVQEPRFRISPVEPARPWEPQHRSLSHRELPPSLLEPWGRPLQQRQGEGSLLSDGVAFVGAEWLEYAAATVRRHSRQRDIIRS